MIQFFFFTVALMTSYLDPKKKGTNNGFYLPRDNLGKMNFALNDIFHEFQASNFRVFLHGWDHLIPCLDSLR